MQVKTPSPTLAAALAQEPMPKTRRTPKQRQSRVSLLEAEIRSLKMELEDTKYKLARALASWTAPD